MNNLSSVNSLIQEARCSSLKVLADYHRMQQEELNKIFDNLTKNINSSIKNMINISNEQESLSIVPIEKGKQKNIYVMLLQLYAKFKAEINSSKVRRKQAWEKIAMEVKKESFKYSKSECRTMIEDLKCDYERYKARKVTSLEWVKFVDVAKYAFEIGESAEASNIFLLQECGFQEENIHILLLKLYAKYKTEFCSSKEKRKRAFQKISREILKWSSFNYTESEYSNMIDDLKSDYESYKARRVTGIELKEFLEAARNAFENIETSDMTKNGVEDDEVMIYTPPKKKPPPLIVLDEDQESGNSSVSDTFNLNSVPCSTSVKNFRTEKSPNNQTVLNDKPIRPTNTIIDNNLEEKKKRKLSSSDKDNGSNKFVNDMKKPALKETNQYHHKLKRNSSSLQSCASTGQNKITVSSRHYIYY